jgi:ABC-type Fe3+-hydroxamate transport system substrate-binding protein
VKRLQTVLLVLVLLVGLAPVAAAQPKGSASKTGKPGAVLADVIEWSGTVTAVDYTKRTVELKGPGGRVATVNAKNARNLDQVKVGDTVKIRYMEELAIFVRKTDAAPQAAEARAVELAPKGQKPAGLVTDTVEITANVEAIDYQTRAIALKGPLGNTRIFKVSDGVERFQEIKVGDQVVIRVTEAIALSVVKP